MRRLSIAAMAAMSVMMANADSCIISGSTERECASAAYETTGEIDLVSVTWDYAAALDAFDSIRWWLDFADPLGKFNSYPPSGFTFSIR